MYLYENKPKKNRFKTFAIIIVTSIITAVVIKLAPLFSQVTAKSPNENTVERLSFSSDSFDDVSLSIPEIIKNSMDSIVGISILEPSGDSLLDPFATQKWGIGTGVIVSEKGYILTNQHLTSRVNSIVTVTLNNGNTTHGKVIWNEPNIDLAIIKINANILPVCVKADLNIPSSQWQCSCSHKCSIAFSSSSITNFI